MATKNTSRNFAHTLSASDGHNRIILYRCGDYPPPHFEGQVYGLLTSFFAKSNIHTNPYSDDTQWSGKSAVIEFRPPGGTFTEVGRLDLLSTAVPYKIDCLALIGDNRSFYFQRGTEIAVKVITTPFFEGNQTVNFYGSVVEERYAPDAPDTLIDLLDTPSDYFPGALLQATPSGFTYLTPQELPPAMIATADLLDFPKPVNNKILGVTDDQLAWIEPLDIEPTELLLESAQTGNYTLALSDAGKFVSLESASPAIVTVPLGVFVVGTQIIIGNRGAGTVAISPDTGVVINGDDVTIDLADQWSGVVTLWQYALDQWWVFGGINNA